MGAVEKAMKELLEERTQTESEEKRVVNFEHITSQFNLFLEELEKEFSYADKTEMEKMEILFLDKYKRMAD